jgi:hypothetical protein
VLDGPEAVANGIAGITACLQLGHILVEHAGERAPTQPCAHTWAGENLVDHDTLQQAEDLLEHCLLRGVRRANGSRKRLKKPGARSSTSSKVRLVHQSA